MKNDFIFLNRGLASLGTVGAGEGNLYVGTPKFLPYERIPMHARNISMFNEHNMLLLISLFDRLEHV